MQDERNKLQNYNARIKRIIIWGCAVMMGLGLAACAAAPKRGNFSKVSPAQQAPSHTFQSHPGILPFINEMVSKYGFQRDELEQLFRQVNYREGIIDLISKPAESKPWDEYRPIFVNDARIQGGVAFWDKHAARLQIAAQAFRVPEEIIVAIIGVETRYGRQQGAYPELDALATLAFEYPSRADFFRDELAQYLLLTREERTDPLSLKGSYAGAMGIPQFMPSSFRRYAVDFDGDGKRDIWNDTDDAIGSVANYFKSFGWKLGDPVATAAKITGDKFKPLMELNFEARRRTIAQLREMGVEPAEAMPEDQEAMLFSLDNSDGTSEYWLGFDNFYVITRYNRSLYYAMSVYQLGNAIKAKRTATAQENMNGRGTQQQSEE
jgi:membrane-bound lytic murein transglycosylase B